MIFLFHSRLLCSELDLTSGKLPSTVKAVFYYPHTSSQSTWRPRTWQVHIDSQVQQGGYDGHRYNGNT